MVVRGRRMIDYMSTTIGQDAGTVRADAQRREAVGGEGAGVDIDPVRAQLRRHDRRVPVDQDKTEVAGELQEFAPDVEEIGRVLTVELDAGSDAGVDGEIAADALVVARLFIEAAVRGGDGRAETMSHGRR